jgi:hypothetical protein
LVHQVIAQEATAGAAGQQGNKRLKKREHGRLHCITQHSISKPSLLLLLLRVEDVHLDYYPSLSPAFFLFFLHLVLMARKHFRTRMSSDVKRKEEYHIKWLVCLFFCLFFPPFLKINYKIFSDI